MTQMIRTGVVLAMFAVAGLPDHAVAQGKFNPFPIKPAPFKPLPKDVEAAWIKAGAEPGQLTGLYLPDLVYWPLRTDKKASPPIFRVIQWPDNAAKLPDPGVPFGLYLHGTLVKDENLKDLAGLKSLHVLSLAHTAVTDKGMEELVAFTNLQVLDVSRTQVGNKGMKEIARLSSLRALRLWETQMTDDGLKELAQLKNLQGLELHGATRISPAGLKGLAGLKLKWLHLPDRAKTDVGLKHYLAAVEPPTYLNLAAWYITDAGLKELAGLKSLQTLLLAGTNVTPEAIAELRQALRRPARYLGEPLAAFGEAVFL